MGEREITIFFIIANLILLIFISGIIAFIIQYRKRKLEHNQEKMQINIKHQQEILANELHIQAQTMKNIGQEIHDNVGQKLTLASIYTQQLEHANKYPELKENFTNISKIINDSISDLRQLSKSLVDPEFTKADLLEMIKQEAKQINQAGVMKIKIETLLPHLQVNVTVKNAVFRIYQEFIQNSLKHANCKNINVSIAKIGQKIQMEMIDDGIGFDLAKTSTGIGLSNMKRRAEENTIGFHFESKINEGSKLILTINI